MNREAVVDCVAEETGEHPDIESLGDELLLNDSEFPVSAKERNRHETDFHKEG